MDKSESELLEEWDVVNVSSVYETEKETAVQESTDTGAKNDVDLKNNLDQNVDSGTTSGIAETEVSVVSETGAVEADPEQTIPSELKSHVEAEPKISLGEGSHTDLLIGEHESHQASVEPQICAETEPADDVASQSENEATAEFKNDAEIDTSVNSDVDAEKEVDLNIELKSEVSEQTINKVDIVEEDSVHGDNLDSTEMNLEAESCEESYIQDVPEILPERSEIEQEMAAIESSSSDIDIIDENIEESIASSFISPLSMSISSSVADTSSLHSITSLSDSSKLHMPEPKIEPIKREDIKKEEAPKKSETKSSIHSEKSYAEAKRENVRDHRRQSQRTTNRQSLLDWFALFIEFLRNMSGYDWCVVGGVAVSLYLTVIVNQTNIFAVVQKENAVSQMKDMIEELKHDNKILKEQLLSEMKNEKVLSSFEHQIKELRKENSKLNQMLYDVAKVLDKQKDAQEKKEAEYLVPFKKEINKLKEHINILKFDNEELQKQLVRMRYASYSQGGKDSSESKDQSKKKVVGQVEEDIATEDIPLDIDSLKKWNELISLLTKELGALSREAGFIDEKSHPDSKNKKPFWKAFLADFKGTFNDLRKINFSAMISDYKKANQRAVSDIYKFVKDFFSAEDNAQPHASGKDDPQWKNIADFVNDLKDKWANIKDRLYTSDLKKFFEKTFQKAADGPSQSEYHSQKSKGSTYEYTESRHANTHFESEKRHDEASAPEETKWMFNRAAHREELRNTDEEVNWFLKKGKRNSDDEKGERHL